MTISQPLAADKLNSPDHALSHRVFANDTAAPVKSVVVDSAGRVGIGLETPNSTFAIDGSMSEKYTALTSSATLDETYCYVDCTANTFDVNLPTASGIAGRIYVIKNSGTGIISVKTSGGQTIDGESEVVLASQYDGIRIISNGTNWNVISNQLPIIPHATISDSTTQTVGSTTVAYGLTLDTNDELVNITHDIIGSTVTISNANPAVCTLISHGFYAGSVVQFSTDGALPTGITANTRYYVIAAGLTADAFQISTSPGGAAVATSSAGSGTHKVRSTSRIKVLEKGSYMVTISSIMDTTTAVTAAIDIWLKKNGTNIDRSNTQIAINSQNVNQTLAVSFILDLEINDYFEFYYHANQTNARILAVAAQVTPSIPAAPSTVVTVSKISS